jgi:hypothetical protein
MALVKGEVRSATNLPDSRQPLDDRFNQFEKPGRRSGAKIRDNAEKLLAD